MDCHYRTLLPPDAVGVAVATRQLGDRLFHGIVLGKCAGTMDKAKLLPLYARRFAENGCIDGDEMLDLAPTLSEIPEISTLNASQMEHLETLMQSYLL